MKRGTTQSPALEGRQPIPGKSQTQIDRQHRQEQEITYWGILCRTCREMVAFDAAPFVSFGPDAASMKPGAIRCAHGHNHIYFPRDFQFLTSPAPIPDAVMRENRDAFRAINSSGPSHAEQSIPPQPEEVAAPPAALHNEKVRPTSSAADPRRKTAQAIAKERWAKWAIKKAM